MCACSDFLESRGADKFPFSTRFEKVCDHKWKMSIVHQCNRIVHRISVNYLTFLKQKRPKLIFFFVIRQTNPLNNLNKSINSTKYQPVYLGNKVRCKQNIDKLTGNVSRVVGIIVKAGGL